MPVVERPGEVVIERTAARLPGRGMGFEERRPIFSVAGDGWPKVEGC